MVISDDDSHGLYLKASLLHGSFVFAGRCCRLAEIVCLERGGMLHTCPSAASQWGWCQALGGTCICAILQGTFPGEPSAPRVAATAAHGPCGAAVLLVYKPFLQFTSSHRAELPTQEELLP